VVVGFIGALIVVRPGHADFEWHALLIVASTVCSAFYQLFSRRYGQTERPDASATVATIVGTVAATPFVPFEWVMPARPGISRCSSAWASWPAPATTS
jgi:drug/metabolite transporter (DMT)-like permease